MLSQKIAFDAHLVFHHQAYKVDELSHLSKIMKEDHSFISNSLPSKELQNYYFAPNGLDQKVQKYFS